MALATRIQRWLSRAAEQKLASDWEGVYAGFEAIPGAKPGFDDDAWAAATLRSTEQVRSDCSANGKVAVTGDNQLLPLVGVAAAAGGYLKVLDFGGGLGISFLHLCASIAHPERVEYHVVETPRLCDEGSRFFTGEPHIRFHAALPTAIADLDIVYLNSSLQYVEDYRALLVRLCALAPRFVLLVRCAAGKTPTFATAQVTLPGKRIPYWFLNVDELVSILRGLGYELVFSARASTKLNQASLPHEYRQEWAMNLLFAREAV
jgi:putative methyltransferase (TIGR04325 family)